jgi:microcystin-dependent protein
MGTPILGEVKIISWNFAPQGWAFCNEQFLPINQNQALFSILGTTFGGNGQTTFALPDFRGRVPLHWGSGFGGSSYTVGEKAGQEVHTLTLSEMPMHNHFMNVSTTSTDNASSTGLGNYWGKTADNTLLYASGQGNSAMAAASCGPIGGSQPHENRQPYLVLNFIIALVGVFPSRN